MNIEWNTLNNVSVKSTGSPDNIRQDRTRQNKTREDNTKTREEKTRHHNKYQRIDIRGKTNVMVSAEVHYSRQAINEE